MPGPLPNPEKRPRPKRAVARAANDTTVRPGPPDNLREHGRALWGRMQGALDDGLRFSAHELELLARAGTLADREAALHAIVDRDGLLCEGSTGQVKVHPAALELRQVEAALCALLLRISTDDTAGQPVSPRAQRASKAAKARWASHNEIAARREKVTGGG